LPVLEVAVEVEGGGESMTAFQSARGMVVAKLEIISSSKRKED
jgi:hypothetical protein